jgi:uncharacterized membrane protein
MEVSKLFGLPAHPLIVHIPVVLLPIAVLGAILIVVSPAWRARIGWLVVVAAGVSLLFVQLAIGSGEVLQGEPGRDRPDPLARPPRRGPAAVRGRVFRGRARVHALRPVAGPPRGGR